MKVITIGRSSKNTISINDASISRNHCQIIQENENSFLLVDLNSTNGTYVNGRKISGQIKLTKHDIVRIGNATLPWQTYFSNSSTGSYVSTMTTSGKCRTNKDVVTIGRSSSNDIVIKDDMVSSMHCKIIRNTHGFTLIDEGSTNGTYINGTQRYGAIRIEPTDNIVIGTTTLHWQNYFLEATSSTSSGTNTPIPPYNESNEEPLPTYTPTPADYSKSAGQSSALGIVALILSLVGAVLLIYVFILAAKWGIFAFIGKASTYMWVSVGINIIAYILATIADYNDFVHSDEVSETNVINVAKTISSIGVFLVIGFYLYIRFGNSNALNPFNK